MRVREFSKILARHCEVAGSHSRPQCRPDGLADFEQVDEPWPELLWGLCGDQYHNRDNLPQPANCPKLKSFILSGEVGVIGLPKSTSTFRGRRSIG